MPNIDKTKRYTRLPDMDDAYSEHDQYAERPNYYAQPYGQNPYVVHKKDIFEQAAYHVGKHQRRVKKPELAFAVKLLLIPAYIFRLTAWIYIILVIFNLFVLPNSRLIMLSITNIFSKLLPEALQGILVTESIFGGSIRGDFCLACAILLILDWLCCKFAARS